MTFEILNIAGKAAIKCLRCGRISYNLNDVRNRYCGFCHFFHEQRFDRFQEIHEDKPKEDK